MDLKFCPKGKTDSCENYPRMEVSNMCEKMFEEGKFYSNLMEHAEGLEEVTSCPIPEASF